MLVRAVVGTFFQLREIGSSTPTYTCVINFFKKNTNNALKNNAQEDVEDQKIPLKLDIYKEVHNVSKICE